MRGKAALLGLGLGARNEKKDASVTSHAAFNGVKLLGLEADQLQIQTAAELIGFTKL